MNYFVLHLLSPLTRCLRWLLHFVLADIKYNIRSLFLVIFCPAFQPWNTSPCMVWTSNRSQVRTETFYVDLFGEGALFDSKISNQFQVLLGKISLYLFVIQLFRQLSFIESTQTKRVLRCNISNFNFKLIKIIYYI